MPYQNYSFDEAVQSAKDHIHRLPVESEDITIIELILIPEGGWIVRWMYDEPPPGTEKADCVIYEKLLNRVEE